MTHVLVIGMSHAIALAKAASGAVPGRVTYEIVNLHDAPRLYDRKTKALKLGGRSWERPDLVCMALEGNHHNTFSLLHTKQKFRLGDAELGAVPAGAGQEGGDLPFVPRDMLKAAFRRALGRLDRLTETIQAHFPGARFVHLCSPPPVLAMRPMPGPEDLPPDFNEMLYYLDFAACPPALRMRIFQVQAEIYAELAARHGSVFLAPPAQALTADGFLDSAHWDFDPTHGNARYGALVLAQIEAMLGQEVSA